MDSIPQSNEKTKQNPADDQAPGQAPPSEPGVTQSPVEQEHDQEAINLYSRLVGSMRLTDEHDASLRNERGFTDTLIDTGGFKSCGSYCAAIVDDLKRQFGIPCLKKYGLLTEANGFQKPAYQLLEDNILIPFRNAKGETFFVRPHKFGLTEQAIHPYQLFPLEGVVILAESEFKAAAANEFGFSSIGIPGISSFGGKHLDRLVTRIKAAHKVTKIVIIFDNEIKSDEKLPNFKPDIKVRWDTQYWAVQMSHLLYRELDRIPVLVGTLPDAWRENGKIDIDGALAQGHSKEEFRQVVESALKPNDYIKTLPEEGQAVVNHKLAVKHFYSPLKRVGQTYQVTRERARPKKGEDPVYTETLSNFVLNPVAQVETEDDFGEPTLLRKVKFDPPPPHDPNKTVLLDPGCVALNKFREFVAKAGNYSFTGNQDDLNEVFRDLFVRSPFQTVIEPWGLGLHEHQGEPLWLFGNCGITAAGEVIPAKADVVSMGMREYRVLPSSKKGKTKDLPKFELELDKKEPLRSSSDCRQYAEAVLKAVGPPQIQLALGWVMATLFSNDLFEEFHQFPLLFLNGKRESGKNTVFRLTCGFLGFRGELALDHVTGSSAAIQRKLEYWRSLPVGVDEYRNQPGVRERWDAYFRGIHDRTAPGRATKGRQVRGDTINAALAILGEETPEDNALFSRCVVVALEASKRGGAAQFDEVEKLYSSGKLAQVGLYVLKRRKRLADDVVSLTHCLRKRMLEKKVSPRVATNYAAVGATYLTVFIRDDIDGMKTFVDWLIQQAEGHDNKKDESHPERMFFEDLPGLRDKLKGYWAVRNHEGKNCVAIHWKTFYNTWRESEARRRQDGVFSSETLRDLIASSPLCVKKEHTTKIPTLKFMEDGTPTLVKHPYACMLLDLGRADCPKGLSALVQEELHSGDEDPDAAVQKRVIDTKTEPATKAEPASKPKADTEADTGQAI